MKSAIYQITNELASHTLELVHKSEKLTSYYLRKPGEGRILSTLITFTPEGIVLQGDLTPGRNGNVSCMGYGLDWFAGRLSDTYLCEKFLDKRWVLQLAVDQLSDPVANFYCDCDSDHVAKLKELGEELRSGDHDGHWLHEELSELGQGYVDDGIPGWGYDPHEAAVLVVIQRRFSELYHARVPKKATLPALMMRLLRWLACPTSWFRNSCVQARSSNLSSATR